MQTVGTPKSPSCLIRRFIAILVAVSGSLGPVSATAQGFSLEPENVAAPWRSGSPDCAKEPRPPLEVREIDASTFVLRESLCATFEGPFMYLLEGSRRALLIDTGDIADPRQVPLQATIAVLLLRTRSSTLPLLVVHTHRHSDHRAGDPQFVGKPGVIVAPFDLAGVQRFFGFRDWPRGIARINLGDRVVDVLPTPGHNETHVAFYDERSRILFGGDFLMAGRLLIDDAAAERESARMMTRFMIQHPVTQVLGGHDEMDVDGHLFSWGAHVHPDERPLPLTAAQALSVLAGVQRFNGLYGTDGPFVMENSLLMVGAGIGAALSAVAALAWGARRATRRRRET